MAKNPPNLSLPAPPKPGGQQNFWQRSWRWFIILGALGAVLLRGMLAANEVLTQAGLGSQPVKTAVLPTLPPQTHQITPAEYANILLAKMSLSDEIAQMLMLDLAGPQLPTYQQQMVQQQHVGGVLVFGYGSDIINAQQVKQLTTTIQQYSYYKSFIATDEEGGNQVVRLQPLVGDRPGEPDIGAKDSTTYAQAMGVQAQQDLTAFGFNMNLAPVVDIQEPGVNTEYGRLYSGDPTIVGSMADAYLKGLQQSGQVIGTLKHFPGLGASTVNPDNGLPVVNKTVAQLTSHEFIPYEELINDGSAQAIMVTHILLPQIDNTYPATVSKKVITGLLRNQLGFQGLVVTDDLLRLQQYFPGTLSQDALLSIEAGSDLLIGPRTPDDVASIISDVTNAINNGAVTRARIDDSVRRIFVAKINAGLIPLPHITVTGTPDPTPKPLTPTPSTTPVALVMRPSPEG
jgi:beta-N-acetylhexosaminidase